jgi:hypothetical protein
MNLINMTVEKGSINHTFSLAKSTAGYIPRGSWSPVFCSVTPPRKIAALINRACPKGEEKLPPNPFDQDTVFSESALQCQEEFLNAIIARELLITRLELLGNDKEEAQKTTEEQFQ